MPLRHLSAAAVSMLLLAPALWSWLDRQEPIAITYAVPEPAAVQQGSVLRIHYRIHRFRVCDTTLLPLLFDGADVRHEYEVSRRAAFGEASIDSYTVERRIPETATPGPARYRPTFIWRCPLNPVHLVWPLIGSGDDIRFTILPKAEHNGP